MAATPFNSRLGYSTGLTGFVVINETGGISAPNAIFSRGITAPNIVYSVNGLTGAVDLGSFAGISTGVTNTFTALQKFSSGLTATGATFSGNVSITSMTSATTYTSLQTFNAGITADGGITFSGPVTAGSTFSFGSILDGATFDARIVQNAFKVVSKGNTDKIIATFNKNIYGAADVMTVANVIDENTTQGGGGPTLLIPTGHFVATKNLITHDTISTDADQYGQIVLSGGGGQFWVVSGGISGDDFNIQISPGTNQTTIFTGHYTVLPFGLTG